jgi:hypothetical protein
MAHSLLGKLAYAEHLWLEHAADAVQQVGQGRIVGALSRSTTGCLNAPKVLQIGLND